MLFLKLSVLFFTCCGYEYENSYDEIPIPTTRAMNTKVTLKTLNRQELLDVEDAIKQLLSNVNAITSSENQTDINILRFLRIRREELTTDVTDTTEMTESTVSTIPTARYPIDVPALLELIAALAEDYESNLTQKLNESLALMSIPTCETFATVRHTTSEYDANATGSVIAKCFVCGLEETGVPVSAPCADAFAGDFLPMVPVDPTARAQISKFRKYCKYQNTRGYRYNSSQPRAIFGRWTGGCAVRWIDLSGIYTQRTCRSRYQAIMGKHFGSKRMARLEMALMSVDNGCIVSPMATLVPLSRGVSLFARFHACVCTGSWCNGGVMLRSDIIVWLIMSVKNKY
ncbi:uncharacterized protein LOC125062787, partial [Pieris napi]|uniref:uncharacterized protein LOC125062787 n=1 Tax=Pieris napi TaxID=78633 RepID=UPI001FBBA441